MSLQLKPKATRTIKGLTRRLRAMLSALKRNSYVSAGLAALPPWWHSFRRRQLSSASVSEEMASDLAYLVSDLVTHGTVLYFIDLNDWIHFLDSNGYHVSCVNVRRYRLRLMLVEEIEFGLHVRLRSIFSVSNGRRLQDNLLSFLFGMCYDGVATATPYNSPTSLSVRITKDFNDSKQGIVWVNFHLFND